ncbi:hypothetical protein [Nonomuraea dietziae]|uniref:Uncharacterized protein n=1 Tax=Nonomuraea dietziae TaxID=65515 RepID=A0A7W5V211_9ACTN|nr:hypothetical protein [Nonomuraea dietziae]MBB3725008.1 hypothetical protein [Nonomuraea dietziae]
MTQDPWRELSELDDLPPPAVVGVHPHRGTAWGTTDDEPPSPTA